jgi:hypothetical protein
MLALLNINNCLEVNTGQRVRDRNYAACVGKSLKLLRRPEDRGGEEFGISGGVSGDE